MINQLTNSIKSFASTVEVFSSDTVRLDMLNTLHCFYPYADSYLRDFSNFPPVFFTLPFTSLLHFFLSISNLQSFLASCNGKEIFGHVGPPYMFLPLWHATLHFTLALTHAQRRVRYHVRSSLHLQCTGIFSAVLSFAAMV